ncbi:hypothetical protein FQN50_005763 [Emmonsiellopsis sp. PD_5]|nr:hypothetical protein FQN50_005763 [Emmonsiellopsis sp. PD_5]
MKHITLQAPKRARSSICQLCQQSKASLSRQRTLHTQSRFLYPQSSILPNQAPRTRSFGPAFNSHCSVQLRFASDKLAANPNANPEAILKEVKNEFNAMVNSPRAPSEEAVKQFLQRCEEVVKLALSTKHAEPSLTSAKAAESNEANATSSLLDLDVDEKASSATKPAQDSKKTNTSFKKGNFQQKVTNSIPALLNNLLHDPKIFISPDVLRRYTQLQTQLKHAEHFPEIFSLYATKPTPDDNGTTITYHAPNFKSAKNAIPQDLANAALDVAIEQKNLPLCLAIIDKSFCMPAYHRSKILRNAALPLAGVISAPTAAYAAASYISDWQIAMDPNTALWVSFSAILAYISFTSSIGVVAITTANDQMNRVVWIPGMPLRERWLREEERAAMDKVAVAWGFKDLWRRGEEEGEEWESLREFIGMRGMILDKTDLMEGME